MGPEAAAAGSHPPRPADANAAAGDVNAAAVSDAAPAAPAGAVTAGAADVPAQSTEAMAVDEAAPLAAAAATGAANTATETAAASARADTAEPAEAMAVGEQEVKAPPGSAAEAAPMETGAEAAGGADTGAKGCAEAGGGEAVAGSGAPAGGAVGGVAAGSTPPGAATAAGRAAGTAAEDGAAPEAGTPAAAAAEEQAKAEAEAAAAAEAAQFAGVTPLRPEWAWEADAQVAEAPEAGNESAVTHRYSAPLAACLLCPLCGDLLKEAWTRTACGHSFCYECIRRHVEDLGSKECPSCLNKDDPGHNVLNARLSAAPFGIYALENNAYIKKESEFQHDEALDAIIRSVFPRPQIERWLESNRNHYLQSEKAEIAAGPIGVSRSTNNRNRDRARSGRTGAAAEDKGTGVSLVQVTDRPPFKDVDPAPPATNKINVSLFPDGSAISVALARPYLHADAHITVAMIQEYVAAQLASEGAALRHVPQLLLEGESNNLPPDRTIRQVHTSFCASALGSKPAGHSVLPLLYR